MVNMINVFSDKLGVISVVSSAYNINLKRSEHSMKSLMYMMKSRAPKIEPWRIPVDILILSLLENSFQRT